MLHAIARRRARGIFDSLSRGDWRSVAAGADEHVHHVFAGDHPLGGERHSRAALERWFERLYRLFPGLRFELVDVFASGPPWSLRIAVEWRARADLPTLGAYASSGAHLIRVRWTRAVAIHAYEDSQTVADACRAMAAAGIDEAAAPPIVD